VNLAQGKSYLLSGVKRLGIKLVVVRGPDDVEGARVAERAPLCVDDDPVNAGRILFGTVRSGALTVPHVNLTKI